MAIRIRTVDGVRVAVCAARSVPKEGDLYLDDGDHHALSVKFDLGMADLHNYKPVYAGSEEERVMEQEESNNPNRTWWDSEYGPESVQPAQEKMRNMQRRRHLRAVTHRTTDRGEGMNFAKLANLQHSIAVDVWPNGAILSCHKCRFAERITTEQAGAYLKSGWPKHCGATMSCDAAPQEDVKP